MKIIKEKKVKAELVKEGNARNAFRMVLLGAKEGSERIEMRLFKIAPGGQTPLHSHPWEHLIRVEKGEGVAYSAPEGKFKIAPNQAIYVPAGEEHQFLNPYAENLELLCVVPLPPKA